VARGVWLDALFVVLFVVLLVVLLLVLRCGWGVHRSRQLLLCKAMRITFRI